MALCAIKKERDLKHLASSLQDTWKPKSANEIWQLYWRGRFSANNNISQCGNFPL